jgi:putative DNA primase/helicase
MPTAKIKLKQAALWYAKFNWFVFPVLPNGKTPLTKNGYKDASTDPDVIAEWWDKWPDANIGLACDMSGVVALDGDPAHYDDESRALIDEIRSNCPTAMQSTPTRGVHFVFMSPVEPKLTNSSGSLPPGIDVRANGYILLAPSTVTYRDDNAVSKAVEDGYIGHYKWLERPDETVPQPLPDHILELIKTKKQAPKIDAPPIDRQRSMNGNGHHKDEDPKIAYAKSALEQELDILARAPSGERNDQLNTSAFSLGTLVGAGLLNEAEVIQKLEIVARAIGLNEREIMPTINSGLGDGKLEPRVVPEPPKLKFRKHTAEPAEPDDNEDVGESPVIEITAPRVFNYHPEDGGILDAWLETFSNDWMFITGYEAWYRWMETHWQQDDTLEMEYQLQEMIRAMNEQAHEAVAKAKKEGDEDKAKAFAAYINATKRSKSRVSSIEGMARQQKARAAASLDSGNALNLLNGTLSLDDLLVRDHDRNNLLTYCLPYEYDYQATCPRFKQFISEVLVKEDGKTPDSDLALLAQELVGYSLTRETSQEAMVWLSGEGGNGKTVTITVLSKLLGPLAVGMDFQTIGIAGNYDLAELPGKRIVFSTESERGGSMAEGYIKRIVSGETINARAIYGKPFSFQSTAKIWWAMNDKPTVRDTSNALYRRLKLIPFHRVFKESEKDVHLIDKLCEELPGILNWAIEGLLRLRRQGQFTSAAAVDAAKDEFRYESNPVAQWLKERTEAGGETLATSAFQNYSNWCVRSNQPEFNSTNFGRELTRMNVQKSKKRTGWAYSFTLINE